jgi:hypothetical protein
MLNHGNKAEWLDGWRNGVAQVQSGKSCKAIHNTAKQVLVSLGDGPWRQGYVAALASAVGEMA